MSYDPWGPAAPSDIHWGLYPGETCISCHTPIAMSRRHGWVSEDTLTVRCPTGSMGGHAGGGPPRTGQLTLF